MSSIVIEEAQIRSDMRRVGTANLAQDESRIHRDTGKKIRKCFLMCKSCLLRASYSEKPYFDCENSLESLNMTIQNVRCPACDTDGASNWFQYYSISLTNPLEERVFTKR